jgi:ADP-heptose:LPS heptosyltransferase
LNPQTIGKIDRRLGKPICWLLTLARRVGGLLFAWRRPDDERPVRTILFIKMIEQGATVLAYRAIKTAVDRVGRENVYFWVFEENRPILDLLDAIPPQNVIVIRARRPVRLFLDMLGTLWRVRKMRFDATVDMEFFSRASAILAFLSGARRRVGLHRFTSEMPYRGDLLTHRVQYNPYLHVTIQYHQLVEAIWADPRERPLLKVQAPRLDDGAYEPPTFVPTDEETATVHGILEKLSRRPAEGPIILLNPNASDLLPLRKWETPKFIDLGKRLLAEHPDALVAITGAPSEREAAEGVARAIGPAERCVSTAGHTTLRQLMVLYAMADVLVTNDSGPGHFSSMTPVDTVVLFGPETPLLFGPLGRHTHVIWKRLSCSPCVNVMNHRFSPCNNNVCMQEIGVDQVYEKVKELLRQRKAKPRDLPVLAEA